MAPPPADPVHHLPASLARCFIPTVAAALALSLAGRLALSLGLLPAPRPLYDVDTTVLSHQTELARRTTARPRLLLAGDSSCLMDVSAPELEAQLPGPVEVRNLGTLSYLSLLDHAALVRTDLDSHPNPPQAVVLLLHPQSLRRLGISASHQETLRALLDRREPPSETSGPDRIRSWLALDALENRLLSRALPTPLAGRFGDAYGFTHNLWTFIDRHQGSLVEPGWLNPSDTQGDPDYRMNPALRADLEGFRARIPAAVPLYIGITPAPSGFALPNHPDRRALWLDQLCQWAAPARPLHDLPAVFPPSLCASVTHLNQAGQLAYTRQLAQALRSQSFP